MLPGDGAPAEVFGALRAQALAAGPAWRRGGPGLAQRPHRGGPHPPGDCARARAPAVLKENEGAQSQQPLPCQALKGRLSRCSALHECCVPRQPSRNRWRGARAGNLHASLTRPFTTHLRHILKTLTPRRNIPVEKPSWPPGPATDQSPEPALTGC